MVPLESYDSNINLSSDSPDERLTADDPVPSVPELPEDEQARDISSKSSKKKVKKPLWKVGIFGGTFDPIHRGHIECAYEAYRAFGLDEVLFVVANQPVYKKDRKITPARKRFDAVCEALEDYENFSPSDIEIERGGDSFTSETVLELKKEYARTHPKEKVRFYLIVGADSAKYLPEWHGADILSKYCKIVVVDRGSKSVDKQVKKRLKSCFKKVHFLGVDTMPLSSTQVRLLVEGCSDVSMFLPSAVQSDISGKFSLAPLIDPLTENYAEERKKVLKTRVSEKRYIHSLGVAQTAREMAAVYGLDERKAYLAGILHDWDKGLTHQELQEWAKILRIDLFLGSQVVEEMPALLHGYTAAAYFAQVSPEIPADVLQAVERHTTAAKDMSELDMILYVADVLEPNRDFLDVDDLRAQVGKISLEELFFKTLSRIMQVLLRTERPLYPDSITVWNYYCKKLRG